MDFPALFLQEQGVVGGSIEGSEFDSDSVCGTDFIEYGFDNTVLSLLGAYLIFVVSKMYHMCSIYDDYDII